MATTKKTTARRGNAHELHAIRRAIEKQTRDAGKWSYIHAQILAEGLAAIALAASTPDDNSATIGNLTARLKAQANALEGAKEPDE